tara:strand:- start:339 stop:497 length:159 start_codon:yes stop_codon:yes gene_type:complete
MITFEVGNNGCTDLIVWKQRKVWDAGCRDMGTEWFETWFPFTHAELPHFIHI